MTRMAKIAAIRPAKAKQFRLARIGRKNRFHKRGHGGPSLRETSSVHVTAAKDRPMRAHRTPEG